MYLPIMDLHNGSWNRIAYLYKIMYMIFQFDLKQSHYSFEMRSNDSYILRLEWMSWYIIAYASIWYSNTISWLKILQVSILFWIRQVDFLLGNINRATAQSKFACFVFLSLTQLLTYFWLEGRSTFFSKTLYHTVCRIAD